MQQLSRKKQRLLKKRAAAFESYIRATYAESISVYACTGRPKSSFTHAARPSHTAYNSSTRAAAHAKPPTKGRWWLG